MEKAIPFCRADIGEEEIQLVTEVLKSGWVTTGKKCQEFENAMKEYLGCKYAIAINSCTAALHVSLLAAGVKPGDEVITTPMTFVSTVNTIIHAGATPVLADIDPKSGLIDPKEIEKKITSKTKAIVPVHYAGLSADLKAIRDLAKSRGIAVIEDAAHAIGTEYQGEKIGQDSDFACFSFYPIKTMTTIEGGLIATNSEDKAQELRALSLHGLTKNAWSRYTEVGNWRYDIVYPGFKYNMTDVQAAVGIEQLKKLDGFIEKRKQYASLYREEFEGMKELECLSHDEGHSYHLFVIKLTSYSKLNRDRLIQELSAKKIGVAVNFIPVPDFTYFKENLGWKIQDFPKCQQFAEGIISLPLFPLMTPDDVHYVAQTVKALIRQ